MSTSSDVQTPTEEYGFPDDDNHRRATVGYKRPPVGAQFKKGKSGNPKGRPRGQQPNMPKMIRDMLNSQVPVRDGETTRNMSAAEALVRLNVGKAIKGDTDALDTVMKMLDTTGRFEELGDEERKKYGVIEIPEKLPQDEWEFLYSSEREADRRRFRAMPDNTPEALELRKVVAPLITRLKIGSDLFTNGELDGALSALAEGLGLANELLAEEPKYWTGWVQRYKVGLLVFVSRALMAQGFRSRGISELIEALRLARGIAAANAGLPVMQMDLSMVLLEVARAGENTEQNLNEALTILTHLKMSSTVDDSILRARITALQEEIAAEIKMMKIPRVTRLVKIGADGKIRADRGG